MSRRISTASDPTEAVLKVFEGFRGSAYKDAVGYGTIGYGHLLRPKDIVLSGKTLTEEEATGLLREDIASHKKGSISKLTKEINHNKMAALTSLAFNHGASSAPVARIVKMINDGVDDKDVANEFLKYNTADGKVLSALEDRRQIESDLFLTPEGGEISLESYGKKREPLAPIVVRGADLLQEEPAPPEITQPSLPPGVMSQGKLMLWMKTLITKILWWQK